MSTPPAPTSFAELLRAYEKVFARPLEQASRLLNLDLAEIRKAYRARVLACHPDRAAAIGGNVEDLEREFREVQEANRCLVSWAEARTQERPRVGQRPGAPLRFGDFLYYSGFVDSATIEAALQLQRAERPSFGALAQGAGLIDAAGLEAVMQRRRPHEPIASAAVRLGVIAYAHAQSLLDWQARTQRPLGALLVALGKLPSADLERRLRQHRMLADALQVRAQSA